MAWPDRSRSSRTSCISSSDTRSPSTRTRASGGKPASPSGTSSMSTALAAVLEFAHHFVDQVRRRHDVGHRLGGGLRRMVDIARRLSSSAGRSRRHWRWRRRRWRDRCEACRSTRLVPSVVSIASSAAARTSSGRSWPTGLSDVAGPVGVRAGSGAAGAGAAGGLALATASGGAGALVLGTMGGSGGMGGGGAWAAAVPRIAGLSRIRSRSPGRWTWWRSRWSRSSTTPAPSAFGTGCRRLALVGPLLTGSP